LPDGFHLDSRSTCLEKSIVDVIIGETITHCCNAGIQFGQTFLEVLKVQI